MSDIPKLRETNYEKRMREEYACYSYEMDLWNTTKLSELQKEEESRKLMERFDAKSRLG